MSLDLHPAERRILAWLAEQTEPQPTTRRGPLTGPAAFELAKHGLVVVADGPAENTKPSRTRTFFEITDAGREALAACSR